MPAIDFSRLPDIVNPTYYPLIFDASPVLIIYGGAGSGKSYFIGQRIIYKMIAEPGHNFLVLRQVAATNRFSTFALLIQIIESWRLAPFFKVNKTDMTITYLGNGAQVLFLGLDDPEKIKSITFPRGILTDIWQEEGSEIDEASDTQLALRLRGIAAVPLQRLISFNPISDQHWLKRVYHDRPQPGVRIVKTTYKDNRFLDDKYRRELEGLKDRDPLSYQVYTLGEWGQAGNLVFRSIVYETCPRKIEDYDQVLVGIDFGYNHYTALEFVGVKDDELYSFRELYVRERTIPDIVRMIDDAKLLPRTMTVTADSAEPKSIDEMRRAGFRVEPAKKGPDSVVAQLRFLNSRRWHIDPVACPGLSSETRSYSWKKDKNGNVLDDEPVAYRDDAIAAVRYAIERLVSPKAKFYAMGFGED